jgi:thioredoxin reductase (NADPH)
MSQDLFDVIIIGAGPSGLAAAIEAKKYGLSHIVFDKGAITNSIVHFPTQMIFFTTPELLEIGGMPLVSEREKPTRNEGLKYYRKVIAAFQLRIHQYEEVLQVQRGGSFQVQTTKGTYKARNIVIAIGYYDYPNMMDIPGEDLPHVSHYYTEAHPFYDRDVVVIGGKNSAVEAALELFRGGARVSLVHRGAELGSTIKYWVRPDIENRLKRREIIPYLSTRVLEITPDHVKVQQNGDRREIPAQHVFAMTGYHPTMNFFDQLGVRYDKDTLRAEYNPQTFETNVKGVYVAGSVVGGRINGEVFIENGRFHGEVLMKVIAGIK